MIKGRSRLAYLAGWAVIFGLSFSPSAGFGVEVSPKIWADWERSARRQCPSHKLDLLGDVSPDVTGEFESTLSPADRKKVNTIANISMRCADEKLGFYCEFAVSVDAFKKIGQLKRFTAFMCHRFKCLEGALCVDPRTGKF